MTCCSAGGLTILRKLNQCSIKFLLLLNLKSAEWNPLKQFFSLALMDFDRTIFVRFFFFFFNLSERKTLRSTAQSFLFGLLSWKSPQAPDFNMSQKHMIRISLIIETVQRTKQRKYNSVLSPSRLTLQKCHASRLLHTRKVSPLQVFIVQLRLQKERGIHNGDRSD